VEHCFAQDLFILFLILLICTPRKQITDYTILVINIRSCLIILRSDFWFIEIRGHADAKREFQKQPDQPVSYLASLAGTMHSDLEQVYVHLFPDGTIPDVIQEEVAILVPSYSPLKKV